MRITDIEGIRIGQVENTEAGTGCTVFVSEKGMRAGVDIRGGGPASRESQLLDPRGQAIVTADDLGNQAFLTQMVQTSLLAVALASGIDDGQAGGMTGLQEGLLDGSGYFFRMNASDKAGETEGIAVFDSGNCFSRSYEFCHNSLTSKNSRIRIR